MGPLGDRGDGDAVDAGADAGNGAPGAAGSGDAGLQSEIGALRRVVDELRARLSSSAPGRGQPARGRIDARGGHPVPPAGSPGRGQPAWPRSCCRRRCVSSATPAAARPAAAWSWRTSSAASSAGGWPASGCPGRTDEQDRRVVALVGPTGVGKTTTIAKIAARALLESGLRVALITVDTYRIGACEHLGRYGEIMGVKTQVARDATSLAAAVARADADLVLIDSAGRSDAETIANQMGLLRAAPGVEMHLVLSAASGRAGDRRGGAPLPRARCAALDLHQAGRGGRPGQRAVGGRQPAPPGVLRDRRAARAR